MPKVEDGRKILEVYGLTKVYEIEEQKIVAVDNVSFSVGEGEFVSIVGHSGSGKTTLLSLIGGLTSPTQGEVLIEGVNIFSLTDDELSELRNEKIGFIYQFSSLIPTLTALENVLVPTLFSKKKNHKLLLEKAKELLSLVGLSEKFNNYPAQLSGGQQRRVAIARAFINDPKIILADEPTGDLDEETEQEIMALFEDFNRKLNLTILLVTHNSELAKRATRRWQMSYGKLSELPL